MNKEHLAEFSSLRLSSPLCSYREWEQLKGICTKYVFIYFSDDIKWIYRGAERMLQVMKYTGAGIVYSDRFLCRGEEIASAPLCDYQLGSVRDDFEFGKVVLLDTVKMQVALCSMEREYDYATWYAIRLKMSEEASIEHIPEFLYYEKEEDMRTSGEKIFDYVNVSGEVIQKEMEVVFTEYLKRNNYYIASSCLKSVCEVDDTVFPVTASVIIPCRNRVRTIGDAIDSALGQRISSSYRMNVIVVDDNSTDGTVEVIEQKLAENREKIKNDEFVPELVYIKQDASYHAIGGNWNKAIHSEYCGKYAIQLDSDDTYSDERVVETFIKEFERGHYAMIIGTYCLTDIDGHPIPPGVISHREWTEANGHNNALRINGLGAPRSFATSVLRSIDFPTVLYGEDYGVVLRIVREYKIGRIWDVVYNCRRWENNSDANCDIVTMNRNNAYKDKLRSWELQARKEINQ